MVHHPVKFNSFARFFQTNILIGSKFGPTDSEMKPTNKIVINPKYYTEVEFSFEKSSLTWSVLEKLLLCFLPGFKFFLNKRKNFHSNLWVCDEGKLSTPS